MIQIGIQFLYCVEFGGSCDNFMYWVGLQYLLVYGQDVVDYVFF